MKPKASTLSKRFGFQDSDLTSPKHDEMILELLNPEKMLNVLKQTSLKNIKADTWMRCGWRDYRGYCQKLIGSLWDVIKQEKIRESLKNNPTKEAESYNDTVYYYDENGRRKHINKSDFIEEGKLSEKVLCPFFIENWRAFTSLCPFEEDAIEEFNKIKTLDIWSLLLENLSIETEHVITNNYSNFVIGFVDLKVSINEPEVIKPFFKLGFKNLSKSHYLEVKTKITSFGETMRQINMYRKFCKGPFILVTKTKGLKQAFGSQGVFIYEWE